MPIKIDERPVNLRMAILLSAQRALLGEIDANLRSVQIDWDEEKGIIYLFFYFDREITPENTNSASCVAGEVAGDFHNDVSVKEQSIRLDSPTKYPDHKLIAFTRKEENYTETI